MTRRGQSFLGTIALIFVSMAGLFVFDTFLAKLERAESQSQALRLYRNGQSLMERGRPDDAIEQFRAALSFERDNSDYQLALARALLANGKPDDAEAVARGVLERDSSSGIANLTLARIQVKEGRLADAGSNYHRAVYGRWSQDAARERLQVRLELIDLLSRQGDKQELLAELLPLEVEKLDLKTREHIAHLYLVAGSPSRAADMFHEILRESSSDADAQAGLGAAEFARGNYRVARAHFSLALRLRPQDAGIAKQLSLSGEVLGLDPTVRGLTTHERLERSTRLVDLATRSLSACKGSSPEPPAPRPAPGKEGDAAEANLEQAEKIWQTRKKECKQALTEAEQPLDLVLTKTAQ